MAVKKSKPPAKSEADTDLLAEARKRFDRVVGDDADNRKNQREDTEFVYMPGRQWTEEARRFRKISNDPCLEFNQLKQFVHQIVNDMRQQRPGIRIHPASGDASDEVAQIIQGMIRGIEYDSNAEAAYDGGYQHAVVGGRGYWRICSEYVGPKDFNQKLCIKRIPDPMTVYPDGDFLDPDGGDADFYFVTEAIDKDEFKRLYPDIEPSDWPTTTEFAHWRDGEKIIVADYYRRVPVKRTLVAYSDGTQGFDDEVDGPKGEDPVDRRDVDDYRVEWYKLAGGAEILDTYDWPGSIIPVVMCMGDEIMVDGIRTFQGAIRQAKTSQQFFNAGMTAQFQRMALQPRAPYIAPIEAIAGYEDVWQSANERNYSYLPYNAIRESDGSQIQAPQRVEGPMMEQAWINFTQQMTGLLRSTTGLYQNSLGMQGNETSGKAINAREKQGDNATFHFVDNLSRAIALTGRILVEVMPKFYDTERIVQTIGLDGVRKIAKINEVIPQLPPAMPQGMPQMPPQGAQPLTPGQQPGTPPSPQAGAAPPPASPPPDPIAGLAPEFQAIRSNDISIGDYAVVVDSGPSYATRREELAETLSQLVANYPPLMQFAGDLVVKAQDIPDAEEISERLKIMLPPPIQAVIQAREADQPPPDPRLLAQVQQLQQQMQQGMQAFQQLQQENAQLKSGVAAKMQIAQLDAQSKQQDLQADMQAKSQNLQADVAAKQQRAQADMQVELHKAELFQQTEMAKAQMQAATALKVAEIQANALLMSKAMVPPQSPVPDQVPGV